jgi:hypothetical protein
MKKVLKLTLIALAAIAVIAGSGCYIYWQQQKGTPQYSLALIVDAAKRNDSQQLNALVDVDAVADDFLPQITGKAYEMYGRSLPQQRVGDLQRIAAPLMPAVKERARAELPRVIRERTEKFDNVPFAAMVLGADRYLDIKVNGDDAQITSKIPDRPLELKMKRSGDKWKVVGIRDDKLAENIAQRVGQELIAVAKTGDVETAAQRLGVQNLQNVLKQAQELIR